MFKFNTSYWFNIHTRLDYQWFPEGKVIFVAPTKPLVAQQIDACHKSCGIPGDDAAELTGQINRTIRAQAVRRTLGYHNFLLTLRI